MSEEFDEWWELFGLLYKRNRDCLARLLDTHLSPHDVFYNVDEIVEYLYDGYWDYFFEDNPFIVDEMIGIIQGDEERLREIAEEMGYDPDEFVDNPDERVIEDYVESYMDPEEVVDEVGEDYVCDKYFEGFKWRHIFDYIGEDFEDFPEELLERIYEHVSIEDLMRCIE